MTQQDEPSAVKRPDFLAYTVRESKDGKGYWNKIGTAWQHRDGQGYDIQLESLPLDGRVTLRELREERTQAYEDQRQDQEPRQSRTRSQNSGRSR